VEMPKLAFKAPTYFHRDSNFLSTRQGGLFNPLISGIYTIFLALAVNPVRIINVTLYKIFSNGIKILMVRIIKTSRLFSPVKNMLINYIFLKIIPVKQEYYGVYPIDLKNPLKFILPPN
jgi:hypothetical protein